MIHAILHNRGLGSRVKLIRATSERAFKQINQQYRGLGFIHLATHASTKGISLIGTQVKWKEVGERLKVLAPKLQNNKQRILCLSCCYSSNGFEHLSKQLFGHFTGIYYFGDEKISFATAMTVWSMFYRKKTILNPAKKIVESVNSFFDGEEVICYGSVDR